MAMDGAVAILLLVGLLGAAGILRLPGVVLVWMGVAVYAWAGRWAFFSGETVAIVGLAAVAGEVGGVLLGNLGPSRSREQREAIAGAGSLLVLGVVLGPYLGTGAWEALIGRRLKLNLRQGLVALGRRFAGRLVKMAVALGILFFFLGRV